MSAIGGMLATLYERQRTGKGRLGECSLLETAVGFGSWTSAQWLAAHRKPTSPGSRHRWNAPYQHMQKKARYLVAGVAGEGFALASNCGRNSVGSREQSGGHGAPGQACRF
jgi:crotonobetainyl-CoA:carnitine CoA-transferase CaiB-like acyl-CoA transferase